MGITAERLHRLKLVDDVMPEPLGGAHRDTQAMADTLKHAWRRRSRRCRPFRSTHCSSSGASASPSYGVFKEG